jgi:hypothetical protein
MATARKRGRAAALGFSVHTGWAVLVTVSAESPEVHAKELSARAAATLGIPAGQVSRQLAAIGRAAGRPWAKDHKESCLAGLIALRAPERRGGR